MNRRGDTWPRRAVLSAVAVCLAVAVLMYAVLESFPSDRWEGHLRDRSNGVRTAQGSGSFEYAYAQKYLHGDMASYGDAHAVTTIRFLDNSHYSIDTIHTEPRPNGEARRRTVANGFVIASETHDADGALLQQLISEKRLDAPLLFGGRRGTGDIESLVSSLHPVADLGVVDELVTSGRASESPPVEILSRTARVIHLPGMEIPGADLVYTNTLYVDSTTGVRLRFESQQHGMAELHEELDLDLAASVDASEFAITRTESALRSDLLTKGFDIHDGEPYPVGAEDVLTTTATALPMGRAVGATVLVSGTQAIMKTPDGTRSGWIVATPITDTGELDALVVQAPDNSSIPGLFDPYWPKYWSAADPTQIPGSFYDSVVTATLTSGDIADAYTLIEPSSVAPNQHPPMYKYLITWVTPVGIRVVGVSNAEVGSRQDFVQLMDDFLDAVSQ